MGAGGPRRYRRGAGTRRCNGPRGRRRGRRRAGGRKLAAQRSTDFVDEGVFGRVVLDWGSSRVYKMPFWKLGPKPHRSGKPWN